MAVTKVKHSVRRAQPSRSKNQSPKPENQELSFTLPRRKVVRFPQAKGKLVKEIEFSSESGYDGISINFQDKTGLYFVIRTGFTIETDYSDWKDGEQRVIRRWRMVRKAK